MVPSKRHMVGTCPGAVNSKHKRGNPGEDVMAHVSILRTAVQVGAGNRPRSLTANEQFVIPPAPFTSLLVGVEQGFAAGPEEVIP